MTHYSRATLIGGTSVLLWGTLAFLVVLTENRIPLFQLLSMTFAIAFVLMLLRWVKQGHVGTQFLRQPLFAWAVGVGGLFGYHFALFVAMAYAPVAEANLLNYLWPLLIVLFASQLPGETLKTQHVLGAMIALLGCWILLAGNGQGFKSAFLPGYVAAIIAAFIWSSYSVLSRFVRNVPTDAVGWFCGVTAVLAFFCHLFWETTVWPASTTQWIGVIGLGLGPVGLAFFTWDHGIKHGNLPLLGVLAFATPLISTLMMVGLGMVAPTANIAFASLAITFGAIIAGMKMPRRHLK